MLGIKGTFIASVIILTMGIIAKVAFPDVQEIPVEYLSEMPKIERVRSIRGSYVPVDIPETKEVILVKATDEQSEKAYLTGEEIDLLAVVTMAEAEGENELGKRLVISTILNRVDHPHFPNTVSEVIWQKRQFSCMRDGRVEQCYVMDDIRELVEEELKSRTNTDVIFFRTRKFSSYGVPMFQEGNHYFSSYE